MTRHRWMPLGQLGTMRRSWWPATDALKLMDVDTVAGAVGVTPRTVRNWRAVVRYPRHSQARALLACVHTWIDLDDSHWRTWKPPPGAFDWRGYRQPWAEIIGWLRGRGYSMVELGERLESSDMALHTLTRRSECSFQLGEALLRVYWRARAAPFLRCFSPRRGWREGGPPPEGVMAPCVWDEWGPPGRGRGGELSSLAQSRR